MRVVLLRGVCAGAMAWSCAPTFAPPLRATHYGAPGRLGPGQMEVAGATGGPMVHPSIGGPRVAVAIEDWVQVEVGSDLSMIDGPNWALGWVGGRFVPWRPKLHPEGGALDLEIGAGAGLGGERCGNPKHELDCDEPEGADGLLWHDRVTQGVYLGSGIGVNIKWFSLYARVRGQATSATNVPMTVWGTGLGGMQAAIRRRVYLHLAAGYHGWGNRYDHGHGGIVEGGVSVAFDYTRSKRGRLSLRPR